ncbi:MAG: hypothetical protein K9L59_10070 [Desulfobacterales bacterium]|nr:hypothetical protein [Desulfobacterales bacterium]
MAFKPNRKFLQRYNQAFRENPLAANLLLLLAELADEYGRVETDPEELSRLMAARFEDPEARQI